MPPNPHTPNPPLLLHTCCAPCLTYPLVELTRTYVVTAYYFNPNIQPAAEHQHRQTETAKFCHQRVNLITAPYAPELFSQAIAGHEAEPERGQRCYQCYKLRLTQTAKYAAAHGYPHFTTVLSISPHKNATWLNEIGTALSKQFQVHYLPADFKKQGGFQKSCALSRQYNLQRQTFCGCRFSQKRPPKLNPANA